MPDLVNKSPHMPKFLPAWRPYPRAGLRSCLTQALASCRSDTSDLRQSVSEGPVMPHKPIVHAWAYSCNT